MGKGSLYQKEPTESLPREQSQVGSAMADRMESSPAGFSAVLIEDRSLDAIMNLVVSLAERSLASVDAATISLLRAGPDRLDSIFEPGGMDIRALDQIQFDTGEGPCMTALHTGKLVRTSVDVEPDRWPAFASLATATGICQVLAIPLLVRTHPVGSLNLYCRTKEPLGHDDLVAAQSFAAKASTVLADFTSHGTAELARAQLEDTLLSRDVIGQATTILTLTKHCSAEDAFGVLRRVAQERHITLREMAELFVRSGRRARRGFYRSRGPAEGPHTIASSPAERLESARKLIGMSPTELWWKYLALGGGGDLSTVQAILDASHPVDHYTYNIISQALNERFLERGMNPPLPPAHQLDWS